MDSAAAVEAFPFDTAPRYLIRDRDAIHGEKVRRQLRAMHACGRHRYRTGLAVAERVRPEIDRKYSPLLDHVVVLDERHVCRR